MTRYLLDTTVVAELIRERPSRPLIDWMAERTDEELYIAALTLAEIRRGILDRPEGQRREELESWFEGPDGPAHLFAGRVLSFDEPAARLWARLMAEGKALGTPRGGFEMIVAATAAIHDCVIVTANERDFAGLDFVNPTKPAF